MLSRTFSSLKSLSSLRIRRVLLRKLTVVMSLGLTIVAFIVASKVCGGVNGRLRSELKIYFSLNLLVKIRGGPCTAYEQQPMNSSL
jgi:hypothetical protein